jgi:hypothetical protein
MNAKAEFSDPSTAEVTITLTGQLREFEELRRELMAEKAVPFYRVSNLIGQIDDASSRLRAKVWVEQPDAGNAR